MSSTPRLISPEDLLNMDNSYIFQWMKMRGYTGGGLFSDDGGTTPTSISTEARVRLFGNLYQASINGGRYQSISQTETAVFNVRDFGAVGDGNADDTAAINSAINAALALGGGVIVGGVNTVLSRGGHVYLPAGKYKITSTIYARGSIGFRFRGENKVDTKIMWGGGSAMNRWLPSHSYNVNDLVTSHGLAYICTTAGISGTATLNSSSTNGTTGIVDGGAVWTCTGYDLKSDMLRFQEMLNPVIENLEFISATGAMVSTQDTVPRAVICSYQDINRLASGTGFTVRDVMIDWSQGNTGLANQHDFGVLWDYCSPDSGNVNNSEGFLHHVQMNGASIAAIQINGSQSQDHFFQQMNIPNSNACSIMTTDGGSFAAKDSNLNCTPGTGTVIVLGAANDRVVIDHCITEDAGRFLVQISSFTSSAWPITIRNCRWSANNMGAGDGKFIIIKSRGPFVFENNIIDGGTGGGGSVIPWEANHVYAVGDCVVNGGTQYKCTTAGLSATSTGPTGTGTGIIDNAAVWSSSTATVVVPVMSLASSGSSWRSRITNNAFIYHSPVDSSWTAADASICADGNLGLIETGNMYVDAKRGDTFMRSEAGNLTLPAAAVATAWAGSTAYTLGQLVTNGGKTFRCAKTGTSSTVSGAGGPALLTGSLSRPETDGGTAWYLFSTVTDGTKRAYNFEVPMPHTLYNIYNFINTRTGSSAASVNIVSYTKTKIGFELTFSAAVTTSDTLTVDWGIIWS